MIKPLEDKPKRPTNTRFSFGATSAIITNLGLIVGLDTGSNAKLSIIGALLIIALADNISDSFGIHIYQELEYPNSRDVWLSTVSNFLSRFLVSLIFVFLVIFLPLKIAVISSVIWGMMLLTFISYLIARDNRTNILRVILEHLGIATAVVVASHFVGKLIISKLGF